jgi:UDP-glucuronate 4-epimerase
LKTGPVLVTGCAGFVGSTLVDRLLAEGRDVIGIDAFEGFYSRRRKEENIKGARRSSRFAFAEVDTRDRDGLRRVVTDTRPTTIVDLAARAGVRDSLNDPWLYIDINVTGVQNLLAAAAQAEAEVVFASSSSVYGDATPTPFSERAGNLRPVSPYGATKVAGEALVEAHHSSTGLPTRVARLFTVYGPRQRPDLAVYKFASALLSGRPIELYDEGTGTRDYTFVADVVDGLVRLVDAEEPQLTVNLGSGRPYSTLDLVRQMEATFQRTARLELLPRQPGDVTATYADITLAKSSLGWEPNTKLGEGLRLFREWFVAEADETQDQAAARP